MTDLPPPDPKLQSSASSRQQQRQQQQRQRMMEGYAWEQQQQVDAGPGRRSPLRGLARLLLVVAVAIAVFLIVRAISGLPLWPF